MSRCEVLQEDIDPAILDRKGLTNDCKLVTHQDGQVDIVRCWKAVDIFDYYYDRCIKLKDIRHAGGSKNPKFQQPEIRFTFGM